MTKSLASPLAQSARRNGPLLLRFHSPYKHAGVLDTHGQEWPANYTLKSFSSNFRFETNSLIHSFQQVGNRCLCQLRDLTGHTVVIVLKKEYEFSDTDKPLKKPNIKQPSLSN